VYFGEVNQLAIIGAGPSCTCHHAHHYYFSDSGAHITVITVIIRVIPMPTRSKIILDPVAVRTWKLLSTWYFTRGVGIVVDGRLPIVERQKRCGLLGRTPCALCRSYPDNAAIDIFAHVHFENVLNL
jgi:hypothetical protein